MFKKITASVLLVALSFSAQAEFTSDASTVLITGSNRGIGLELARQYAENGWNVIATSRREAGNAGLAALRDIQQSNPNLHIERIDVTSTEMILSVAAKYSDQPIDVLINNAAKVEQSFMEDLAIVNKPYSDIDFDDAAFDFSVNTLGPMRMIQAFMPHVMASEQKKIVNVTSFIGSFGYGEPSAMGMNYGASKAALNMYTYKLAVQVKDAGVIVALMEPVMVQSKPGVEDFGGTPVDIAIEGFRKEIRNLTMDQSGKITNFSTGNIDPY